MTTKHPANITPNTAVNTYGHPEVVAKYGYGYNSDCSSCFLNHGHTWAEHYQSLLFQALCKQFGDRYLWTSDKEQEMHQWEKDWWKTNTPFEWDRKYRQTYSW